MQSDGDTPLFQACRTGNFEHVVLLVDAGASIWALKKVSSCCVCSGNFEHVVLLVDAGTSIWPLKKVSSCCV